MTPASRLAVWGSWGWALSSRHGGGPMKPVKSSDPVRMVLVAAGLVFLVISVVSMARSSVGSRVFFVVLTVISAVWCFRAVRMGLVIDQDGVVERSIGPSRRTPWGEVAAVVVRAGRGTDAADYWLVELRLRDGRVLPVGGTASRDRSSVEEVGHRIVAMRAARLGGGDAAGLLELDGGAGRTGSQPRGDAVVGPDGVPVVVRLTGPGGVKLDWGAAALPDGLLVALVAAVVIGVGRLVSVLVRKIRRMPGYEVNIEVGGPEPRSVTLPFDSRAQAAERARELVAAVGERGADAVPRASGR
ncbi:hypothetical protein [Kitasatospora sp. NPDC088783]|uniref:hypothetical protein n=1 Tax=Kitasatospora sp. NPDC088783 TaxID=3364077 RepID=UPI0037F52707